MDNIDLRGFDDNGIRRVTVRMSTHGTQTKATNDPSGSAGSSRSRPLQNGPRLRNAALVGA